MSSNNTEEKPLVESKAKSTCDGNGGELSAPMNMILDGVDQFSKILENKEESEENSEYSLWVNVSSSSPLDSYTRFWQDGFLTDFTLLVGPNKTSIRVHRVVLAAHFEYFQSMFSSGLKETMSSEVHLPFICPEDLRLILNYAYSGNADLTKENVLKMAVMANFFGGKDLMNKCSNFLKKFTDVENCVNLLEVAIQLDINQMRKNFYLFIVDHLPKVNKDDLSALPVDVLLEIIQHPAAAMVNYDHIQSEKELFYFLWNRIKSLTDETKTQHIPKVLKAIHLPKTDTKFLFFLLKEFGHIPEAKKLIIEAENEVLVAETREWYLMRSNGVAWVTASKRKAPIEVNGVTRDEYSRCVLVKGYPFFIYATSSSKKLEKEYHVESPVAIENLALPYKVILEMENGASEWISVNTYKEVVDKRPVDESYKDKKGWFHLRVKLRGQ